MSRGDTPGEGHDGMCTLQNGMWLRTHSFTYHIFARVFPVAFPAVFISLSALLLCQVLPNCRGFPLTSLSLASSQLLMQTPRVQPARRYQVTHTKSQHLGRFVI